MGAIASRSVFASRDFRLFYAGQAASYIGDGLRTLAIPLLVFKLTGSALNLGASYAVELLSYSLFGLVGGSLADRTDRKQLLIACDLARCAILVGFAVGYWSGWLTLPLLYAGIILHSACGAVFSNSQASSIPYVVGKERATHAVAMLEGTFQAVNIVAPPVGGALFALVGPLPALVINALTYVISLGALTAIRDLGPDTVSGLPRPSEILADVALGFRFLVRDQTMRILSSASFIANGVGMIGYAVLIPFVEGDLHAPAADVGFAFGAIGAGSVIGSLLATRFQQPFGPLLIAAHIVDGLAWVPLAFTHSFVVTCICLGVSWTAGGFALANILGWRMRVIPEEMVGRVFAANRLVVLGGTVPGGLIGGAIADRFGARIAIDISAGLFLLVALVLTMSRTVRAERR